MYKAYVNFLLFMGLWSIHTLRALEEPLAQLNQSLELLSKSIAPGEKVEGGTKKEPWINPKCFAEDRSGSVLKIKFDGACGLSEEGWSPEKFNEGNKLLDIMCQGIDLLSGIWFEGESSHCTRTFQDVKFTVLKDWPNIIGFYTNAMTPSSDYVNQLIFLLFYRESVDPGSWNENFDAQVKPELKGKWLRFMKAFRDKMESEGWKGRTNPN